MVADSWVGALEHLRDIINFSHGFPSPNRNRKWTPQDPVMF